MKNLFALFKYILALLVLCTDGESLAQSNLELTALEKCERFYDEGFYSTATEKCAKIIKKAQKDGRKPVFEIHLAMAKYMAAASDQKGFNQYLSRLIADIRDMKVNKQQEGLAWLRLANIYLEKDDIISAKQVLQKAKELLASTYFDTQTDAPKGYLNVKDLALSIQLKIKMAEGQYQEVLDIATKLLEIKSNRIEKTERYFDVSSGTVEDRKLSNYAVSKRNSSLAMLMNEQTEALWRYGDYQKALVNAATTKTWIKNNLTKKDISFYVNRHTKALIQLTIDQEPDEAKNAMEKNAFAAERIFQTNQRDYLKIHADLVKYYASSRLFKRGKWQSWRLGRNTKMYYTTQSIPYGISQKMLAEYKYHRNRRADNRPKETIATDTAKRRIDILNSKTTNQILMELYTSSDIVPKQSMERIGLMQQLYESHISMNQIDEAFDVIIELSELKQYLLGTASLSYHFTQLDIANHYLNYTDKFAEALAIYRSSFDGVLTSRLKPQQVERIQYLENYTHLHEIMGQLDSARSRIDGLLSTIQEHYSDSSLIYATALERLVDLELDLGQYHKVEEDISKIQRIFKDQFKERKYHYEYIKYLRTHAKYASLIGLYQESRRYLAEANTWIKKVPSKYSDILAVDDNIDLNIRMGKFKNAYAQVVEVIEERTAQFGENSRFLVMPNYQKALLLKEEGEFIESEEQINKAKKLATNIYGSRSLELAEILDLEGSLYLARGDYDKADQTFNELISIQKEVIGENTVPTATSYSQLALVKLFSGKPISEVEQLFKKSKEIIGSQMGKQTPPYANALKKLAILDLEKEAFDQALSRLDSANAVWISVLGKKNIYSADIYSYIGDVELRRERFDQAEKSYQSARKIYKRQFSKKHPEYIKTVSKLAKLYYSEGKKGKARRNIDQVLAYYDERIKYFFPALTEEEKSAFWELISKDFEFFYSFAFTSGKTKDIRMAYENLLATKGLLLDASIRLRKSISQLDPETQGLFKSWIQKKDTLAEVISLDKEQIKLEGINIKDIQKEIDLIEIKLSQRSEDFRKGSQEELIKWKDIKAVLRKGEAAVEIIRFRHFNKTFTDSVIYVALITTPDSKGKPKQVILAEGTELETKHFRYYKSCMVHQLKDRKSYANFWEAIDRELEGIEIVYLSSQGVYNQLNVESLKVNDSLYIIDKYEIDLISSTKVLLERDEIEQQRPWAGSSIVLMGHPIFYESLAKDEYNTYSGRNVTQLPGTDLEIQLIADECRSASMDVEVFRLENADEKLLRSLFDSDTTLDLRILHIATHGFFMEKEESNAFEGLIESKFVENPLLRSGVLLSNGGDLIERGKVYEFNRDHGVLTAYEAANMNLVKTELVILSACETGKGQEGAAGGVYGLQRAFLVAGVDNLIMSLFRVSDEATQKLMYLFYKNMVTKGMEKKEAFRAAKQELKKEFGDPIFWAAFIMIGDV